MPVCLSYVSSICSVWNTVVNLLARSLFGESFWEKKRMFLSPNALERVFLLTRWHLPAGYCDCPLPSTASIEIQLTFKKLITMSKTFLCDEPVRPSGTFAFNIYSCIILILPKQSNES